MFVLHERLKADTHAISDWPLSSLRLLNDTTYPWLVLVPRLENITEMHQLSAADQTQAMAEMSMASRIITDIYSPDKINIGALGNLVPQLHIHVLGRFRTDPSWPGPVWGAHPPKPYDAADMKAAIELIQVEANQAFA